MNRPALTGYEHRDLLAAAATRMLADREHAYPELVERGRLTPGAAEAGLRCARALALQWQWIVDRACPVLPPFDYETGGSFGAPSSEIAADLTRTAERTRDLARRTPADERIALLADCYAALAWCQQGDWIVQMIDGARTMTRQLRAAQQARLAA